ncbi:unnamed protein product [Hymenolepis diminuta]|uniref:JmjC domain-containing protein n=1 Tax=Hymenolepis diminuta TaxID=6216 RepID=A0A0R3SQX9_HYMDI|nr:unnamed protein product [Hymenolepis diminuta]
MLGDYPLVARKAASSWTAVRKWSVDYLTQNICGNLSFRMGSRASNSPSPQFECVAQYVSASIADFVSWRQGNDNPSFRSFPFDEWWAYASYLYMSPTSSPLSSLINDLHWGSLFSNLPDSSGSTFWLGTDQSHTACHYDTYGINIVLQVFGKKRWILFPPSDSAYLYPTRLPLEESTVFSRVNFQCPNFIFFPLILNSHPHVITLEPGDVLYVPRHWWHYVECIEEDYSCAVNMWIDQPLMDDANRCKEALTQLACFSLAKCAPKSSYVSSHFHENERSLYRSKNWFSTLVDFINNNYTSSIQQNSQIFPLIPNASLKWSSIPSVDIVDILPDSSMLSLPSTDPPRKSIDDIIAVFLHPDVIDAVHSKLCE